MDDLNLVGQDNSKDNDQLDDNYVQNYDDDPEEKNILFEFTLKPNRNMIAKYFSICLENEKARANNEPVTNIWKIYLKAHRPRQRRAIQIELIKKYKLETGKNGDDLDYGFEDKQVRNSKKQFMNFNSYDDIDDKKIEMNCDDSKSIESVLLDEFNTKDINKSICEESQRFMTTTINGEKKREIRRMLFGDVKMNPCNYLANITNLINKQKKEPDLSNRKN